MIRDIIERDADSHDDPQAATTTRRRLHRPADAYTDPKTPTPTGDDVDADVTTDDDVEEPAEAWH